MLNDAERAAYSAAVNEYGVTYDGRLFGEHLFAAGIAYAQTWRSMESAPKDGTAVLLNIADVDLRIGHWDADYRGWESYRSTVYPTGWLPLPPTQEAK